MDLNPGAVTPELVAGMNAAGFSAVAISAESGSDRLLRTLGKNYTREDLGRAAEKLRGLRARRMWIFLVGAPGENEASVRETAAFLETLPRTDLVFLTYGVRLLPGTALRERLVEAGELDAGEELLWPRFYFSPEITRERAEEIFAASAFPTANRITVSDGLHPLLPLVQRVTARLGLQPPYWRHGRALNRLRRALRL
jgi:radical SAM superfamily enzyme YgiQ (UPF0313 family)